MDLSRLKKVLAGASAAAITLTQIGSVFAAYSDVPSGIWYEDAVMSFTDAGYLDASQTRFRGTDNANRAEFVKLLVELNGGILATPPATPTFDDVPANAWYYGYMEDAAKEDWVMGDKNCKGTHPCYARPAANINRAEAATLIVRAFGLEAMGDAPQFADNPSGQWYTDAIQTAADHCVLQGDGSTGRVRPSDNMNRAEMVVMLNRVDQDLTYGVDCTSGDNQGPVEAGVKSATATSSTTVEVEFTVPVDTDTAEDVANYTVSGGATMNVTAASMKEDNVVELTVDPSFDAEKPYTVAVDGVLSTDGDTITDTAEFEWSTKVVGNGDLEVAPSPSNPVGDTVPRGANGVTILSLDLSASCADDVSLDTLTVLHEGFGPTTDIDGVYAAVDGSRLSRRRSIDTQNQTADLRFRMPLVIKKCDTVTVDIVADFSSTATISGEHNFVVELPSDVDSNAKQVTGSFPVRGETFKVAAVSSGIVSILYRSVSPNTAKVGEKDVVVGRFEISANSVEDQTVYSMTLQQNGSASDGDVTDLRIQRSDSTVVSNRVPSFTADHGTFVFDPPLTVKQGDRITLEVVGEIAGGATNNVQVNFEEASDIFAVGSLYGYGVNGQLYGSQISLDTAAASTLTIDAGQFTMSIDGPSQKSYTRDQTDAILANIKFDTGGGDDADIRKMFIAIEGETSSGQTLANSNTSTYDDIAEVLSNITLRDVSAGKSIQGVAVIAGQTAGVGTYGIYRFDDLIVKGKSNYELRVNFKNNGAGNSPKSGNQFRVHICGEPTQVSSSTNTSTCAFAGLISATTAYNMQIEGLSTGDKIEDVRPRGVITGNFMRIASSALTVAVKSIGTSDTAVKNSKNVNLLRFEARPGEAKDLLLTNLVFNAASGSLNNGSNYSLWVDGDGDGNVDTILDSGKAAQGGTVTFNKIAKDKKGFVLAKEQTVVFEVHTDIASSFTSYDTLQLQFATSTTGYITAEELDTGSSLSGIKLNAAACSTTTCDITLSTVASKVYTLVNQGNLYVTRSTTTLRNRQILGGTLGEAVLRLQLRAEYEDIDVTDLQLNSSGSTASSVDRLELYKDNATTAFATATVGACGSDDVLHTNPTGTNPTQTQAFCAQMDSRQLVVPRGQTVDVLVRPRLKTDESGATPNETVSLFINSQAVANNTTGSGGVRARGDQSSNTLSANTTPFAANGNVFVGVGSSGSANAAIVGTVNKSVLSKILTITNANPDGATANALPTGQGQIAAFKITTAPNSNTKNGVNKVTLSGVIFNVQATNVNLDATAGNFRLRNNANPSITHTCSATNLAGTVTIIGTASGSFLVQCKGLPSGTVSTEIDQGSEATFGLEGNVTGKATTGNASLQISLQNFDSSANLTFGPTTSHFAWRDKDNSTTTTADFRWVDYGETTIKSTAYSG